MNWKIIFGFGLLLLFTGSAIGFIEGGLPHQDGPTGVAVLLGSHALLFSAYMVIFACLAYRQAFRPFAHAVLAAAVDVVLSTLAQVAISLYLPATPIDNEYIFIIAELINTTGALALGVPLGRSFRNRRSVAGVDA